MRITKIFAVILTALALTALIFTLSGCKKEEPQKEPPKLTTQYTVTFYEEDGSTIIEKQTYTHGDRIIYPTRDKTGHTTEWTLYDLDQETEEEIHVDLVTRNMKAVVKYVRMDCAILILDSVTNEELVNQYYYYGDVYTPDIKTDKPGYNFLGFTEDGTNYVTEVTLTGSTILYAMYEPIPYTVTYLYGDVPEYRYQHVFDDIIAYYGTLTLPTPPQIEGYTFEAWYVSTNTGSEPVENGTYEIKGNTTFWAEYTKNTTTESTNGSTK